MDVMEKHKIEFLARRIWENLKSGRGWVHVVELDQDTDQIMKIVRQFAEEDSNFPKEKPYCAGEMTINFLPLLENESGVFYTTNFTVELIPHQDLYKMMLDSTNEEVRRIATDSYDLDSQSFEYSDKFALFKVNEYGVETWVNGVHLSSCGSLKDVQKNKKQYELIAAINRVLPEGSIFIGDMNVSLIEEAERRFGKITDEMKESWPVQKSENNVTTNMTYGYILLSNHNASQAPWKVRGSSILDNIQSGKGKFGKISQVTDFVWIKSSQFGGETIFYPKACQIPFVGEPTPEGYPNMYLSDHPVVGAKVSFCGKPTFVVAINALADGASERPFFNQTVKESDIPIMQGKYLNIISELIIQVFGDEELEQHLEGSAAPLTKK